MMDMEKVFNRIRVRNDLVRVGVAEFIGTFILTVIGDSVIATVVLSHGKTLGGTIGPLGWGLALVVAILVSGGISGGHVNPAVTVALASIGKCSWRKVWVYFVGQYLGGFVAAAVIYGVYIDSINHFDGGIREVMNENATAQIFATYPQEYLSAASGLGDQIVSTMLLLMAICAVTDPNNMNVTKGNYALLIGLSLAGIMYGFVHNCQAALNPARDLAPRIFTAMAGWGSEVFSYRNYNWFWVPIVGPHIGAVIGAWIYKMFLEVPAESYDINPTGVESQRNGEYRQKVEDRPRSSHLPKIGQVDSAPA